jgi:hypothetical protein
MDLDELLAGVKNRTESVDDLLTKSSSALDALLILHADLATRYGRETGFEHLVLHLVKSNLQSVEGAVGVAGLLAILLVKEADRNSRIEDVARFIHNTERPNGTDHWLTATNTEKNLARLKATAALAVFNGITTDPITQVYPTTPQDTDDDDAPQVCPTTGYVLNNIATVYGRWVCCGGLYPDHQPTTP